MTPYQEKIVAKAFRIVQNEWSVSESETIFNKPAIARQALSLCIAQAGHDREHFAVAFLDSQHKPIKIEVLFSGTLDGAAVYPREIVRKALEYNCKAIVLSHNHPSGVSVPSEADRKITQRIVEAARLLDINVIDHIIITPNGNSYSFAEHGCI